MANKKEAAPDSTAPELQDLGTLREKHGVGRAVFAGVCAAQGWRPGKAVSEDAFLTAVRAFSAAPMGKKEAKDHAS